MNFNNEKMAEDRVGMVSGAAFQNAMKNNAYSSGLIAGGPNAPAMETISQIQMESTKLAYELCSMLENIGDALGGALPTASGSKDSTMPSSLKGSASEVRMLLNRAMAAAVRIGSHL